MVDVGIVTSNNRKMSIFKRVYQNILENKRVREEGGYVCIPWDLPRLSTILPGIQRAKYYIITASSKVGKSQLTDFLFLHQPYEFYMKHPTANIKPRIFYFSLEMSKESKIMAVISYKLFKEHGISISPEYLLSVFEKHILDTKVAELIATYDQFFEEFESRVTFHDNIRNPYGIFKTMEQYADSHGKWTYKDMEWTDTDGSIKIKKIKDFYTPNDPEELVIVITDHVSLLNPEKVDGIKQDLHSAMSKFSSDYCLHMRDKFKYTVVNVQQQMASQEKQQYTLVKGESIVDKLRPSADGLADNKLLGRDFWKIKLLIFAYIK